jgi:single-strand DNA-binding protein
MSGRGSSLSWHWFSFSFTASPSRALSQKSFTGKIYHQQKGKNKMAYLNRTEIIGNTGKPATVVTLPSGGQKVLFSVAVSKKYRDKNGEQKEITNWFNVVCFGKLAENIAKLNIGKGIPLFVSGEMNFRNYVDQNGQQKNIDELQADAVQILTPRTNSAPDYNYSNPTKEEKTAGAMPQANEDELPF